MDRRCPDCSVSMEAVEFLMAGASTPQVKTDEAREDFLGRLGMNERHDVDTVACPECGLLRFYAAVDD